MTPVETTVTEGLSAEQIACYQDPDWKLAHYKGAMERKKKGFGGRG